MNFIEEAVVVRDVRANAPDTSLWGSNDFLDQDLYTQVLDKFQKAGFASFAFLMAVD